MDRMQAEQIYEEVAKELNRYSEEYYLSDEQSVSDAEYDAIYKDLCYIVSQYPDIDKYNILGSVGVDVSKSLFRKIAHIAPMLSLDKVNNEEEEQNFINRITNELGLCRMPKIIIEPKLDGLSLCVRYTNGILSSAATRGDGYIGEDVTNNAKYIMGIPQRLNTNTPPEIVEIRGEAVMLKEDFYTINQKLVSQGKKPFSTPRNAAAGSIRQTNAEVTRGRNIHFIAYSIIGDSAPDTHIKTLRQLTEYGFNISPTFYIAENKEQLIKARNTIERERATLPFDIDGAVYKIDSMYYQKILGNAQKYPRHSVAFKFSPKQAISEIVKISWQVGRTGAITPVADIRPVNIGGVIISRVSLHNQNEITRKNIKIGGEVLVKMAGDVIPYIEGAISNSKGETVEKLEYCPYCGAKVVNDNGLLTCPNRTKCKGQLIRRIEYACSREVLNIPGMGEKTIEKMVNSGKIEDLADIFKLTKEDVSDRIFSSIQKAKKMSLSKFIYALGISNVGLKCAEAIAAEFSSIDEFVNSANNEFSYLNAKNINIKSINECIRFFNESYFLKNAKKLANIVIEDKEEVKKSTLRGVTFVFTGTLDNLSREEARIIAEKAGANICSDVSSKTTYLVCGEKAGSKKERAEKLGVKIITQGQFLRLCFGK